MTTLVEGVGQAELMLHSSAPDHSASSGSNPTRNALSSSSRNNKWKRRGVNITDPESNVVGEWIPEDSKEHLPTQHWSAAIAAAAAASEPPKPILGLRASDDNSPYGRKGRSEAWSLGGKGDLSEMALHEEHDSGEEESGNENEENNGRTAADNARLSSSADGTKNGGTRFQRKKEKREHYNRLMELLYKDNHLLTEAICSSVLSSLEDEVDIIFPEIVRYMLSTQMATDIIVRLVRSEVLSAVDEGTILRGNEPISVMLTAHAKIVGRSFLRCMLKSEIALLCDEINQHKIALEIDPTKLKTKGNVNAIIEENTQNLITVATRFLERIRSCVDEFPSQIRYIAAEMRRCLLLRFPSSTVDSVLGGYIFLRLICPIIVSPAVAGLSDEDDGFYLRDGILQKDTIRITPEAQRGLILLSKLLQQLANGSEFGWKEEFMIPLNSFLAQSRPVIQEIFRRVSTISATSPNDDSVALEKGEIHLIKFIFHKLTFIGIEEIESFVLKRKTSGSQSTDSSNASVISDTIGSEDSRIKLVADLKQTLQVLGKPPRSLRKYYDIVFYNNQDVTSSVDVSAIRKVKGEKYSVTKKLKKMKKKMKIASKKDHDILERMSESPSKPRSGIRRRATQGKDMEMWRSDSCGKVNVLERTTSRKDLRMDEIEAVRRVRSSDKPQDMHGEKNGDAGGSVNATTTDSEDLLAGEEIDSDDDSETGSDFDLEESDDDWKVREPRLPLSARAAIDSSASHDQDDKTRKKAEMAKKLLEEKYKSHSMRNLRAEREALKIERQNDKRLKEGRKANNPQEKNIPQIAVNSGSKVKREGRSVTLTDVQVVKREQENEAMRKNGALSPRSRNLTSPPSQNQVIAHKSDSSSDSSSDDEDVDPIVPERASPKTKGVLSRIPILRIPGKEDFKFLSPRRTHSGRKEDS